MKDKFPGFFKDSDAKIQKTWRDCVFVFDANILLDLYRYSDSTRSEFLGIIEKINDKVWMPHRAVEEYLGNRLKVIGDQEKSYDDARAKIDELKVSLSNSRHHPFVDHTILKNAEASFKELQDELDKNKGVHNERMVNDEIKESIADLFNGKVGDAYSEEQFLQIFVEGQARYDRNIPPGFKDAKKGGDDDSFEQNMRKFGDYIVWKQVLDFSAENHVNVVFVTDDRKDDWWEKFKGKTIGPRPEIVKEFKEVSGKNFYMYQADRFLQLAKELFNSEVSDAMVEEIREVSRHFREDEENELHKYKIEELIISRDVNSHEIEMLDKEADKNTSHIMEIYESLNACEKIINDLNSKRFIIKEEHEQAEFDLYFDYKMREKKELAKSMEDLYRKQAYIERKRKHLVQNIERNESSLRALKETTDY